MGTVVMSREAVALERLIKSLGIKADHQTPLTEQERRKLAQMLGSTIQHVDRLFSILIRAYSLTECGWEIERRTK